MTAEELRELIAKAADLLPCPLDVVDLDEDNPFTRCLNDKGELVRVGQRPRRGAWAGDEPSES
jgi:hypothetical protein